MRGTAGCSLVFISGARYNELVKNTEKHQIYFEIVMIFRCFGIPDSILVLYLKMRRSRPILQ
jgi:hypothetical protein